MRILIATGIFPPDIGGPATMIGELRSALNKLGHEVKIVTYASNSICDQEVYRVNRQASIIFRYLKFFYFLLKFKNWAEVIYVTDIYSVGYFAYILKKFFGKKYIVRFAGDSAWETAVTKGWTKDYIIDFQTKKYSSKIEKIKTRRKKILVNADNVIVVSNFLAEVAKLIGVKANKISVIYNSVEFETKFITDNDKILSQYKKNNEKIIVTACRLTPWKGVDGIIRILPDLIKKIGPTNFLVLGDGSEKNNLIKLAENIGVKENVFFLGAVSREKVDSIFKSSDVFILNSNYEGLSHTLLEAMQAELPIVATNIGGNPEVITDNQDGLLVEYNNDNQLLDACFKILSQPALANSFKQKAKEKLKKFDWQSVTYKTNEIIKKVICE